MIDEKPRVIIIPAKPELAQETAVKRQLRVAAYCRVSTEEEEQASSYEAQCQYYTDKIMSRNTLDCINYTRILRQLGIGVLFEKENINSLPPDSEFMITMYGAMAQSESESISGNVKWGKKRAMEAGKVSIAYKNL